jgi:hypothetical protein
VSFFKTSTVPVPSQGSRTDRHEEPLTNKEMLPRSRRWWRWVEGSASPGWAHRTTGYEYHTVLQTHTKEKDKSSHNMVRYIAWTVERQVGYARTEFYEISYYIEKYRKNENVYEILRNGNEIWYRYRYLEISYELLSSMSVNQVRGGYEISRNDVIFRNVVST